MGKSNKLKRKNKENLFNDQNQMQEIVQNSEELTPLDENKEEGYNIEQDDQQITSRTESSDEDEGPPQTKKAKSEQNSFGIAVSTILGTYQQHEVHINV